MHKSPFTSKGFDGHLISQACGAINDNLFRNTFAFIATASGLHVFGLDAAPALGLIFMLGMLIFQPIGGFLADRLPMHLYIRSLRCSECFLVLLGIGALSLNSLPLMLGALFLLGAQSGLYGPAKYAIIPLLVPDKDLEKANGQIQAWTTISIITGIILTAALDPKIISAGPLAEFS
ncbi:MAG: MFS transporter, partial [Planctomycetes bacterium]|nr:MFS transporter [Planctomycetota bacterium]